jgi:hypothetical protein
VVSAYGDDPALIENDYLLGVLDGGNSLSYNDDGA